MKSEALQPPLQSTTVTETAFRQLFDMEFDYVWRSLRRLGIPARDLEDVTHDVFLRVNGQLHRYDPARPARPWLFGFVFRVASDYRRLSRNHREVLDGGIEGADPHPSAVDRLVEAESLSIGYAVLECMDIDKRAVFILHELDGTSIPDAAQALSIPLNTAYSRLRAAREQFNATVRRMRLSRGDR
jgi:RNA polymerase sigma-70 factor (ECF subfamily)